MSVTALIVAAGKGERLGGGLPKQFRNLGGKPVLRWAVEPFLSHRSIDCVRLVIGADQEQAAKQSLGEIWSDGFVIGGHTRQESVLNGLAAIATEAVLIHDASRPFCPPDVIDRLVGALESEDGAVPVMPVADTLARAEDFLVEPVDRLGVVRVQTPQAFHTEMLRKAHAAWTGQPATDDATIARAAGARVAAVAGDPRLEKLTTEADWRAAEEMLAGRMVTRAGTGFDVHAFGGDGPVMMGGIEIPHDHGLSGHSDADVVLHAITDALLGAGGLGDIGEHFPPSDGRWKDSSSDLFLAHAAELLRKRGGIIDHVDCTVICEEPKVAPHRLAMRRRVAAILGIQEGQVSIKATTTEGLGFTGRREGIAAQAVASVRMETIR